MNGNQRAKTEIDEIFKNLNRRAGSNVRVIVREDYPRQTNKPKWPITRNLWRSLLPS
jgi:hypothetical protein